MRLDALVAGEVYIDLILSGFDLWPRPGEEAFAREFRREIGGGAAITACGLARLGTSAAVFGVVGADHRDWMAGRLAERGVSAERLAVHADEPTGFTVAVTAQHDRAFFTYLGANRDFPRALEDAAGKRRLDARHVHLGFAPDWAHAAELFDAIHANACSVSLDAGWHEDWLTDPRAMHVLSKLDIFFPNETEAMRMTGETEPERILRRFEEAGLKCVALKLGARGAAVLHEGEIRFVPALAITPRDPTGAGDCFDAGFLDAWLRGGSAETCLRAGNICGGLSCEAYGGIEGFPSRERLEREMERAACGR
jgi:sugar/nucleoside kinase (ribokinase family)